MPWNTDQRRNLHRAGMSTGYAARHVVAPLDATNHVVRVDEYTSCAPLSQLNFEAALNSAIAAAQALPTDTEATVVIPPGNWIMTGTVLLPGLGRNKAITLAGAGKITTRLQWLTVPTSGFCIDIDGTYYPTLPDPNFYAGGLRDLSILGDYVSSTAVGIRIRQSLDTSFVRVGIEGFYGATGTGLWVDGGHVGVENVQNTIFQDMQISLCGIGSKLRSLTQGYFSHVHWNNNLVNDILLDGANQFSIISGMFQSPITYSIVQTQPNEGGSKILIDSCYHESVATSLLKTYTPTGTFDTFDIRNSQASNYDVLVDLAGTAHISIKNMYGSPNTQWVKARNCIDIVLEGTPDPIDEPSFYDLDDISRAGMTAANRGLPYSGQHSRGEGVTGIIAPVAVEVWDASKASLITLTGGNVQRMTGLVNGSFADAATAGQRLTYQSTNSAFFNQPTVTCTSVGNRKLAGTFNVPIAAGKYPGCFVVFRAPNPTAVTDRGPVATGTGSQIRVAANDSVAANAFYGQIFSNSQLGSISSTFPYDERCHAVLVQSNLDLGNPGDTTVGVYVDSLANATFYGLNQDPLLTGQPITTFSFCGFTPTVSADLEIAYLAFMDRRLSEGEITQVMSLACDRWGIG